MLYFICSTAVVASILKLLNKLIFEGEFPEDKKDRKRYVLNGCEERDATDFENPVKLTVSHFRLLEYFDVLRIAAFAYTHKHTIRELWVIWNLTKSKVETYFSLQLKSDTLQQVTLFFFPNVISWLNSHSNLFYSVLIDVGP